jgi:hypothetical protein
VISENALMGGVIDEYLQRSGRILREEFDRIRSAHQDSDVKGAANEGVVADFLAEAFHSREVVTNSSVIDRDERRSKEIDVALCNDYQPFMTRQRRTELLIVEGVDAVVQVKARLTRKELARVVDNCRSVKSLRRTAWEGEQVFASMHDIPAFVLRIPYFCFCFGSALSAPTVRQHLIEAFADVPSEEQPDGIFVLNKFSLVNVRENKGNLTVADEEARGLVQVNLEPLSGLIYALYQTTPVMPRRVHPLLRYWRTSSE